ncbi:phospholipase A-2-activating protein [Cylas formicarius]|uniref:phospholipase A-2-activating protein n=1 Tax=Cylas formicarius TaxID=197179 RepID=UPI002958467D|nr:phospholipase A-2-activating protein [Cylas formicarius]
MSKKEYRLSKSLYGHSLDVRCVVVTSQADIISCSRDKTAKFWKYNPFQNNYEDVMTYKDHKNFVGCVLYLEPTEEFPDGLVVTGGNDNLILIYKPSEPFATFTLKEHSNAVSCLSNTNEANCFLSGSWDTTAKYFRISGSPKCAVSYIGHTAAVWSVIQLKDGRILTASADKTIGVWNSNGEKLQSLTGHTDCVRSLADFAETGEFISVANDAAIKVWSYSGENLNTYYGPTSYIYSIARCKAGGMDAFVTSGEDRTVRYWQNGENTQTITLPAQSVWTVQCLPNGDIVSGSSDGVVRIFTKDESRYADEHTLTKFNEDVTALEQQSVQEIGGVKVSDLPGKEALYDPGKREGQMKMIREDGKIVAYTWNLDGNESCWVKVGDVMGGTDKDAAGRTLFEGKAYDFVFSVDVEDGKPPLKLPYNRGDDVYKVAQEFLTRNFLPSSYLEQVVDFILKNSKEQYVSPASDPFTGGSRYTPAATSSAPLVGTNVDPLTGGSSYSTSAPKPTANSVASSAGNADPFTGGSSYTTAAFQGSNGSTYFPVSSYRTFDAGDPNVVLNKLKEFNAKLSGRGLAVSDADLEALSRLCTVPTSDVSTVDVLFRLLNWPEDFVFPVLDIVRLAVRIPQNNETVALKDGGALGDKMKKLIGDNKVPSNTIVALRTVCNLCAHPPGQDLIFANRFDILEHVTSLSHLNKNAQIAAATVLLNLTVLCVARADDMGLFVLAQVVPDILTKFTEPEAHFRAYLAIGTLVNWPGPELEEIKVRINESEQFLTTLQLHGFAGGNDLERKRTECVKQLRGFL